MESKGSPAIDILHKELGSVIQSIADMNSSLREAKKKRRSLEAALEVLGASSTLPGVRRSRIREDSLENCAVRILQEEAPLTLDEVVRHLVESGRETARPSVTTALSRLKRNKVVRKGDDDRWYLTEANESGDPKSIIEE